MAPSIFDDLYFMRFPGRLYKLVECLRTDPQIQLTSVKDATTLRRIAWGEMAYRVPKIENSLINYVALQGGVDGIRHKEFYKMSILVAVELLARQHDVLKGKKYSFATPNIARGLLSMVLPAHQINLNNIRKMQCFLRRKSASHVFINLMADDVDHLDEVHVKAYSETVRRYFIEQVGQNQENSAVAICNAVDAVHGTEANTAANEKTSRDAKHTAVYATDSAMIVDIED